MMDSKGKMTGKLKYIVRSTYLIEPYFPFRNYFSDRAIARTDRTGEGVLDHFSRFFPIKYERENDGFLNQSQHQLQQQQQQQQQQQEK